MLKDYSEWEVYEGASEGSGRSDKEWLRHPISKEIGLFKFTKTENTTENVSEKLASELAVLVGFKSAKIDIGTYNSRRGCMSYLINNEREILIEGIYLINKHYPTYDPYTMYDSLNEEYYSLKMILNSVAEYNIQAELIKICVFDFLIGNTDRHQSNWAVLAEGDSIKICPLYDNGSSLCCYIQEENLDSFLGKDLVKFNAQVNSKSKSIIRINGKVKKHPTHYEVLRHIKEHYYLEVAELIDTINSNITEEKLDRLLDAYPSEVLSIKRKQLIRKFLLAKVDLMNGVFSREEE